MSKLIITADIHGHYTSWLTFKALLEKDDCLAVAGDLFDTRYGSYAHPDFDPEKIRDELNRIPNTVYYVYGNCDDPSFLPGYSSQLEFEYNQKKICLVHGHRGHTCENDPGIVIQGHTHIPKLEQRYDTILLNPGTITAPRNGMFTFAVMDQTSVFLVDLKTGKKTASIRL